MTPEAKAEPLVGLLKTRVEAANGPLFVAFDGRSGAGKSTLAATVKSLLSKDGVAVAVIEGDQFYAGGSSQTVQQLSLDGLTIVMLEGACRARPELHEHLDLLVLLDPPEALLRQQLLDREGDAYRADWEGRWSEAEDFYFGETMTPDRFDLFID